VTDILEHIDEALLGCLVNAESFGLCHLVEDTNGFYPTGFSSESRKVFPSSKTLIYFYHRLLNGSFQPVDDLTFGKNRTRENTQVIRTVVFIPIDNAKTDIDDFINALPDHLTIDNYRRVKLSDNVTLIRDSAAVWAAEYAEAYRNKFQKIFQVYAIEYSIEYIKCKSCYGLHTDNGNVLLTDDGDVLLPDRNDQLVTDDGDLVQTDTQ
jgi:hypothetical protein